MAAVAAAPGRAEEPAVSLNGLSVTFTQPGGAEHEVLRDLLGFDAARLAALRAAKAIA